MMDFLARLMGQWLVCLVCAEGAVTGRRSGPANTVQLDNYANWLEIDIRPVLQ
jgi:hypothetical protein